MQRRLWIAATAIALGHPAWAQTAPQTTNAEVRKVDLPGRKITLKHGEIKNLDMPPMTMVFEVPDPQMLTGVQAGDAVRFTADKVQGRYTLTGLERVTPR